MSPDRRRPGPLPSPGRQDEVTTTVEAERTSGLRWRCDVCRESIADGDGWLTVAVHAAIRRQVRAEQVDQTRPLQAVNIGALMRLGDPTPWRAVHATCDPDHGQAGYVIIVSRIRTFREVLEWWAHLDGKGWVASTDWRRFVLRTVAPQLATRAA